MGFTPIDESEIASSGAGVSGFTPISEQDIAQPEAPSYASTLLSTVLGKKGLGTDLYNGIVQPVVSLADAADKAQQGPFGSTGESMIPNMLFNFFKGKEPAQAAYDTGAVASSLIPVVGPYVYAKAQQYFNPDQVPATTAEQDAHGLRANALGTAALLGVGKAAGAGLRASSESQLDPLVGYNPAKKTNPVGGLDVEGNFTADASRAVERVSKQDLKLQDLKDSEFPSTITATDTPNSVALKLWKFRQEKGQNIGSIIEEASSLEKKLLDNPDAAPWQKEAYLQKTSPDFSNAQNYIDTLHESDQALAESLQPKLDNIKSSWADSAQTLSDLKKTQENFGLVNKKSFNPDVNQQARDSLNNLIYGDLADKVKSKVSLLDDKLGTQLTAANKDYSAAATFDTPAFNAARKGATGRLKSDFSLHGGGGALSAATFASHFLPGGQVLAPAIATLGALKAIKDIAPVQTMKATSLLGKVIGLPSEAPAVTSAAIGAATNPSPKITESLDPQKNSLGTLLKSVMSSAVPDANASDLITRTPMDKAPSVIDEIKKNPVDHAIMLMESNGDAKAKNPHSSASGLFQLISGTAKNLGVKDVFDPADNYAGFKKLKEQTIKQFKSDDINVIYAAHYLGAPTLKKWINGDTLTAAQQQQVNDLKTKLLPKLNKIYSELTDNGAIKV